MFKDWTVSTNKDWNKVTLYNYSLKNKFKLTLQDVFYNFDAVITRHWLCGSGLPETVWCIPLGKPVYDHEDLYEDGRPFLENSVGNKLMDFNQKFSQWVNKNIEKDKVKEIFITNEELIELVPEWEFLFDDEDSDNA